MRPAHTTEPAAREAHLEVPVSGTSSSADDEVLVISCGTCVMAATEACNDCMMNVLCPDDAGEATGAVVLDLAEQRALRLLAQAGMVPTLRHRAAG